MTKQKNNSQQVKTTEKRKSLNPAQEEYRAAEGRLSYLVDQLNEKKFGEKITKAQVLDALIDTVTTEFKDELKLKSAKTVDDKLRVVYEREVTKNPNLKEVPFVLWVAQNGNNKEVKKIVAQFSTIETESGNPDGREDIKPFASLAAHSPSEAVNTVQ